jgi:hypothetical protein
MVTAFCRRIRGFVDAGQVHSFPRPPRVKRTLHFTGIFPVATLVTTFHAHGPREASTTYDYYISSYFGSCHYDFIFAPINSDIRQAHYVLGQLIQIKEIPWGTRHPTSAISNWRIFQHEDALTREGESDVTRLMAAPQPRANGPAAAQEGSAPMPNAGSNSGSGSMLPSPRRKYKIEIEIN